MTRQESPAIMYEIADVPLRPNSFVLRQRRAPMLAGTSTAARRKKFMKIFPLNALAFKYSAKKISETINLKENSIIIDKKKEMYFTIYRLVISKSNIIIAFATVVGISFKQKNKKKNKQLLYQELGLSDWSIGNADYATYNIY